MRKSSFRREVYGTMTDLAGKRRFMAGIAVVLGLSMLCPKFSETAVRAETVPKEVGFQMKNILVDKQKKEIRIRTNLAITKGILEYLLVGDAGKTYESVFQVTENLPSELNFALLLIGSEPLDFKRFMQLRNDPNGLAVLKKDHPVSLVEVDCLQNGHRVGWENLLKNRAGDSNTFVWVHTGGFFLKDKRYAGDVELSHIAIWQDPSAVINLFSNMGNPYRGGFGLEMNRGNTALKVDQEFEIVIRRNIQ